jgi:hypothetical protein
MSEQKKKTLPPTGGRQAARMHSKENGPHGRDVFVKMRTLPLGLGEMESGPFMPAFIVIKIVVLALR